MILISRKAAARLFSEIQRWVDLGLSTAGTPLESLVYPLSAMVPTRGLCSPLELVDLNHIAQIVIDDVAIPPDEIKVFSAANCHFEGPELHRVNREFNAAIAARLDLQPRLEVLSKLHCHPFPGGDFLSSGDLHHGVAAPEAVQWRRRKGLATALLHVVYPSDVPCPAKGPWRLSSSGATSPGSSGGVRWRVRSWGSAVDGALADLGDARVVADSHPLVRLARRLPYWRTKRGRRWCARQKQELRHAGYDVRRNLLGRGWRHYLLHTRAGQLVFALPPDFPRAPLRVMRILRAWADEFEPLELPGWASGKSLGESSLLRLARYYEAPG